MTIVLLVGGTFLLLGLLVLLQNQKQLKLAVTACNWPVTVGRIIESRISYARPKMDDYDCLTFFYKYEVDGVSHISKSIDFFGHENGGPVDDMEKIVQAYPQGSEVKIYYDPSDPSVSALEPEHRVDYFRSRNMGVFLIIVGILFLSMLRQEL